LPEGREECGGNLSAPALHTLLLAGMYQTNIPGMYQTDIPCSLHVCAKQTYPAPCRFVPNRHTLRVAKCQGYWGYIRVKMFAGWGKKFERRCNFEKSSLFGKIYASFSSFPCTN
jgi:hypothetical protein